MTDDPDAKVRLQLLATLGYLHTPAAAAARGKLLARDLEDKWFQVAALSAGSDEAARTFAGLAGGQASPGRESLLHSICAVIGTRQKPAEVQGVLQKVASVQSADAQWWRTASLEGLGLGMRVHHGGVTPAGQETLLKLTTGTDVPVRRAALRLLQITGLPKARRRRRPWRTQQPRLPIRRPTPRCVRMHSPCWPWPTPAHRRHCSKS